MARVLEEGNVQALEELGVSAQAGMVVVVVAVVLLVFVFPLG